MVFHYTDETSQDDASTTFNVKQNGSNPKTGDQFNMKLWVGLMTASAVAVVAVIIVVVMKKKNNKK